MIDCPTLDDFITPELDRVLTQYRESPNLLFLMQNYLQQVHQALVSVCDLPSKFDLATAVGDQLTMLGKRLGFPRCHCICVSQPVFGFECDGVPADIPIVGFCEDGTWIDCGEFGTGEVCINDDEVYRGFLSARRYQMMRLYDRDSLTDALQSIWGATAWVMDDGNGRVVLTPGRDLTASERVLLQIVPRVLPVPLGINQRYHFGPNRVFGFGEGWGGFCEEYAPDGLPFMTEGDTPILVTEDVPLITGPLTRDAEWMCEIDVKPYECAGA